jgi:hypothetical protein
MILYYTTAYMTESIPNNYNPEQDQELELAKQEIADGLKPENTMKRLMGILGEKLNSEKLKLGLGLALALGAVSCRPGERASFAKQLDNAPKNVWSQVKDASKATQQNAHRRVVHERTDTASYGVGVNNANAEIFVEKTHTDYREPSKLHDNDSGHRYGPYKKNK